MTFVIAFGIALIVAGISTNRLAAREELRVPRSRR